MKDLLFITNGHGEDLVAAKIIQELGQGLNITALPVVGEGRAFEGLNAEVIGPRKKLPSGGFSLRNFGYLLQDLFSGLIGNTLAMNRILKDLRGKFSLTVAIGDIVPIISALKVRNPFIFIGVNKSSYYKRFGYNYTVWEKYLLRTHAKKVFVRDRTTADDLPFGEYVGNPLLDCYGHLPRRTGQEPDTKIIGFLPGTRSDANLNIEDFVKIIEEIIKLKNSDFGLRFPIATTIKDLPEYFQKEDFDKVLSGSDLIIGLSGTGNEQAAGSGVPLVSFYGRGSQYNKDFAEAQKQLLGDALSLVRDNEPLSVAAEVWQLLRKPDKLAEMSRAGKERMGSGGACQKIADYIKSL